MSEEISVVQQLQLKAIEVLTNRDEEIPVASPCISVCRMTEDRSHCKGCFRTIDEIRAWSKAASPERLQIWTQLLERAGVEDPRV